MQPISYQLYSSRNFGPLPETFRMLADMGYAQVEGYGALYAALDDIDGVKAALVETGLQMPSGHFGLDLVEGDPAAVIKIAGALGVNHVFVPYLLPEKRPSDLAGWKAFGARLEAAGKPLVEAGLGFGWHNHDFEFAGDGDTLPIDAILEGGPSLAVEFDVAWAARAGKDPSTFIANYGPRIASAHVKDIAREGECVDEDGWSDVGLGVMDWGRHMAELRDAGCQLFVMEHDNPSDDRRFAQRSIDYLRTV
ncbi:sugar phosphate isomerase/epimerase family protein [Shimia biformata]|uniref:sugar phosphate isomerase/epimerase family protein n=1 Tax=Shimia biformata TaxID=1294299 RepID=UPI00194DD8E7|nr:sugar phosphate isomerase/epimerase [Shimia biformata]